MTVSLLIKWLYRCMLFKSCSQVPIRTTEHDETCWHTTQDDLAFLRVFRDPVEWSATGLKSLVQTKPAGGREGTLVQWLSPAPPFTVTNPSDDTVHSQPPSPQRCPHLRLTSNAWRRDAWVTLVGGRM